MFIGLVSGMVFVYGLDLLTAKLPAKLRYHFQPWKVLRYEVEAEIDNLTVLNRNGRKVPVRYQYTEKMELNYYFYHATRTGNRVIMMELMPVKITPKSITLDGRDATQELGPSLYRRMPPPKYTFFDFEDYGEINGLRRSAGIRDMIVST